MDIDPMESATAARDELAGERAAASRLSSWVARRGWLRCRP